MTDLSAEYMETGGLSEGSYEALKEAGYPREVVDAYIRGVQAQSSELAEKDVNEVLSVAGGREKYGQIMEWAGKNLSQEEQDAYNKAVRMGNKDVAKLATQGIVSRYEAEFGRTPKLVRGGGGGNGNASTGGNTSSGGFSSRSDMVTAMSDKRYGRDPDYTAAVEAMVRNSKLMTVVNRK
jgi:hypothetical protein